MELDKLVNAYNYNYANLNQSTNTDALLQQCNNMIPTNTSSLDQIFNQKSPYNFPALIICDDSKRNGFNTDIYENYMDIIKDECGNRYNIRNQKNVSSLQAGYAQNIDLESELHRINHYADKCYYNNYKINPSTAQPLNNGLKHNANIIKKDYRSVGQNIYCVGNAPNPIACYNTPPSDFNDENNVRKRYVFDNKFVGKTCLVKGDRKYFTKVDTPVAKQLIQQTTPRNCPVIISLNSNETKHNYYKFGDDNNAYCAKFPPQRLFHNSTKRSTLPNFHNLTDIGPEYLS
jgi:hypothetical protein